MQSQVNNLLQLPFHHLKVADLRDILRSLGLRRSGNKDTLIDNLKLYLRKISQTSDIHSLTVVSQLLEQYLPRKTPNSVSEELTKAIEIIGKNQNQQILGQNQSIYKNVVFVKTPFIKPLHTLYCGVIPYSLLLKFMLNEEQSNLFQKGNKNYKILLFCASQKSAEESINNKTDCPIQYPCNPVLRVNELTVNGMEDVIRKHNKAWSTRPVDITYYCKRKKGNNGGSLINEVRFLSTFISSKWKDFVVKIIICEYITLQEAVSNIKKNFLSKEEILRKRLSLKKGVDDDIEATSSIVSLRCPISRTRIKTPCRFKECTHVQCFDLTSYLQLNEKYPNWKCPVCNTRYSWKSLVMDGYIQDILNNVSPEVDSIAVEVNGTWHIDQTSVVKPTAEEEYDEEEDLYFKKLEEEMKASESVIDLTSDDELKSNQGSNQSSSVISINSTPTLSTSTSLSIPSISIPDYTMATSNTVESHPSRKRTMADLIAPRRKKVNGKSTNTSPLSLIRPNTSLTDSNNILQSTATTIPNFSTKPTSSIPTFSNLTDITDLTNLTNFSNLSNVDDLQSLTNITNSPNLSNTTANILDSSNPINISDIDNITSLASSTPTTTKGKKAVDLLPKVTKSNPYFVGIPNLEDLSQSLALSQLTASLSQDVNYDLIASSINETGISSLSSNLNQPSLTSQALLNKNNNNSVNTEPILLDLDTSSNSTVEDIIGKKANDEKLSTSSTGKSLEIIDITNTTNDDTSDLPPVTDSPIANIPSMIISSSTSPSLINSGNLGVQQPNSLDLFSNSNLLSDLTSTPSVLKSKSSITIPASIPTSTNTLSMNIPKSYSSPLLGLSAAQRKKEEENLRSSLLKSALFNHSIAPAPAKSTSTTSPFISSTTPKLKSLSLNNSPRLSSPRLNSPRISSRPGTPLSSHSSPGLGVNRTPTKYKNITPKPVKTTPTFDLNTLSRMNSIQYLSLLNSMNPQSNNPVSSASLTNPLINSLFPLGTPTDPSSLLYYQSLNSLASTNSLLTNTNLSQLATPPPIPSLCDPSLLSAFQATQNSTNSNVASSLNAFFGSDLANSLALALGASVAPPTTLDSSKILGEISSKSNNSSVTTTPVGDLAKGMSTPILTPDLMETDTSALLSGSLAIPSDDNGKKTSTTNIGSTATTDAVTLLNSLNAETGSSSTNIANGFSGLNIPITIDDDNNASKTSLNTSTTKTNKVTASTTESTLATALSSILSSATANSTAASVPGSTPLANTNATSANLLQNINMNLYLNQLYGLSGLSTTSTPPFNSNDPNLYSLMMSNPSMASALASSSNITPSQLNLLNTLNAAAANPISSTTAATTSTTSNSSSSSQVKTPNLSIPFTNLPFI